MASSPLFQYNLVYVPHCFGDSFIVSSPVWRTLCRSALSIPSNHLQFKFVRRPNLVFCVHRHFFAFSISTTFVNGKLFGSFASLSFIASSCAVVRMFARSASVAATLACMDRMSFRLVKILSFISYDAPSPLVRLCTFTDPVRMWQASTSLDFNISVTSDMNLSYFSRVPSYSEEYLSTSITFVTLVAAFGRP